MQRNPRCESIYVASRGLHSNQPFFADRDSYCLQGVPIKPDFRYTPNGFYFKNDLINLKLTDFELVFLRLPRPVSDGFLKWLDKIFAGKLIINHPLGIIETSNKKFLLNFPDLCPEMKLCYSVPEILDEAQRHPIVIKPLKEYGGRGLLRIKDNILDDGQKNYNVRSYLSDMHSTVEQDGLLVMKYLKNVVKGDKRILVADGEILASTLRLPSSESWLCNVSQGGKSVESIVTEEEKKIVDRINPLLLKNGIFMYGVDTLENDEGVRVLSEINTLSIGGFPQAEKQSGKPIIKTLIDKIFDYASKRAK
jgi:glutathione synthase